MSNQEVNEDQLLYADDDVQIVEENQSGLPRPNTMPRRN